MAHMRAGPKGFDYYWTPAGAHTAYPPNWEGVVKQCVLDAAIKAGTGEDMDIVAIEPESQSEAEPTPRKRLHLKIQDASDSA